MTYIADWNWSLIGSFLVGAIGVGLGIWNRFDQWRDRKRARMASLPRAELVQYEPRDDGWTPCQVFFFTPSPDKFDVVEVRARTPALFLAPRKTRPEQGTHKAWDPPSPPPDEPDLERSARTLEVSWKINPPEKHGAPAAQAIFYMKGVANGAMVRFQCRFRFNKREVFTIDCKVMNAGPKRKRSLRSIGEIANK